MRFTSFVSLLTVAATFAAAAPVPTNKSGPGSELERPIITHDLAETRVTLTEEHHPQLIARTPTKTKAEHEADAGAHTLLGMKAKGEAEALRGQARDSHAARMRSQRASDALPEGHEDKQRLRDDANAHRRDARAKERDAAAKETEAQGHFGRATASRDAAAAATH
ncbi:hypothetical protein FRC14_007814 [Serendipita sp. 396]|nr:hypothetical protein FRC14_007814 [Serendipita sp. 396]KAG8776654.1 hypothetical protein FRC15_011832 [Serendipita sp. 397]KAG8793149.1 hypothetical protein FRC16_011125 [Serendipita sp. 398]KAG8823551.1 hypothetical protein FRC19_003607 [Serendipita sp. 401]KAG8825460.1 hypothetical protein FRC18_010273 [Serendipita sp. 400]KAG8854997.1 hypothetical protein FRB91_002790 [Serendipita sp. 411]KAG8860035.1 hypothetical protein FRC20_011699 [Serendipita sp. 405]KAG9055223.1 hypothetical prot